jgi:5-formyltetrahydrofolate cyclo-ligase
MKTKHNLRGQLKTVLDALHPEEKKRQSGLLCERLLNDQEIQNCTSLGIYLALPDEPDLRPALTQLFSKGIQIALPFPVRNTIPPLPVSERPLGQAVGDPQAWNFRFIHNLQTTETGPWDLDLPKPQNVISASELDIILIPGRGFTSDGDRIGWGKGIYDQLLAHSPARKIGIGFSCQILEQIPSEPHDIQLDEVWTA